MSGGGARSAEASAPLAGWAAPALDADAAPSFDLGLCVRDPKYSLGSAMWPWYKTALSRIFR